MAGAQSPASFVTPTWGILSSPLGWRLDPFRHDVWQHHSGIDIAAPTGMAVLASAPGKVRYVGMYAGYGQTIYVEHKDGWATVYAHLSRTSVRPGQTVPQGAVIGAVGNTGRSTGPHLHFEIRYKETPVNPLNYLNR